MHGQNYIKFVMKLCLNEANHIERVKVICVC